VTLEAVIVGGLDVGDNIELRAPAVGVWEPLVGTRRLIRPGDLLGHLHVLGVVHRVIAPPGARGIVATVIDGVDRRARVPVGYGARLYRIDPATELGASGEIPIAAAMAQAARGLVFTAPTSGRYYSRPGPGKPPFVSPGDEIGDGHTICLIEVMKTFNRIVYESGHGLPERARVVEVVARDEDDVDAGATLLRLEDAS
jgi:acetyl-CoA carboxylase biotin carboxyl carrier protein